MDNKAIAQLLGETADLLEIAAGDPFRIRSYRRAAEAVENSTEQLSSFVNEPQRLLAIQGIGKGMAANIQEIETRGSLKLRDELLTKYRPTMLELLKLLLKLLPLLFDHRGRRRLCGGLRRRLRRRGGLCEYAGGCA